MQVQVEAAAHDSSRIESQTLGLAIRNDLPIRPQGSVVLTRSECKAC